MRLLSRLISLNPILVGIEECALTIGLAALCFGVLSSFLLPLPSPDLLRDIANIGIVLVLAYVVEAASLVPRMIDGKEDEDLLGILLGIGIAGLFGVAVAVLLAAHRAAHHGNLLDDFGLGWVVSSVVALAGMVILHPMLAHVWEGKRSRSR